MKKTIATLFVALLVVSAIPTFAGDAAKDSKQVQLTGYITDEFCGAKNANSEGADCTKACADKGADVAIYADGKMYKLSDKAMALEHVGYEVVVIGTLNEDGSVEVASIEKADA